MKSKKSPVAQPKILPKKVPFNEGQIKDKPSIDKTSIAPPPSIKPKK